MDGKTFRTEYLVFGFALVTLAALTMWWSTALVQWVDGGYARQLLELEHEALNRVVRNDPGDYVLRDLPHRMGCSLPPRQGSFVARVHFDGGGVERTSYVHGSRRTRLARDLLVSPSGCLSIGSIGAAFRGDVLLSRVSPTI